MNLSINLTLGSPVADSASNSVVAAEDMSDQGFGLRLADELNERELAPLMLPDAKKADDPALLEQIAMRQQIAADAETFADKDGRVWLEDPLAGLPDTVATDDTIETFAGDKPWLDIIEKANNYSTVLQANKNDSRNVAEKVVAESTAAAVDPKQDLTLSDVAMLTADQASEADRARSQLVALADEVKAEAKTAATSGLIAGSSKINAGSAPVISPSPATGPSVSADVGATQAAVAEAEISELSAEGLLLQPVANESAAKMVNSVAMEPTSETTVTGTAGQKEPDRAPQVPSNSGGTTAQSAERAPVKAQHEVVVTDVQTKQTDLPAVDVMHKTSADRSDKQTVRAAAEPALSAAEQAATQQETERLAAGQQTVVVAAMQAGTVAANRPGSTQTTGAEKAPAANAFAVHLRAVNQTQQQQQQPQSGAEQQPGQGQAKANIDIMALNPSGPVVTTVPAFAQQLQQVTETTPVTGSVSHTAAHSAATTTGNTTLLSARPAETPVWQPPLALTEPAAAQQIKDRVMVQIQHKLQTAEVQLHPEELGSMQIKLNLQQDQLSVQFVVQQGAAKEALEQQMPKLRELLEQQGIALSEGQVEQRQSGSQQEQPTHHQGTNTGAESEIAAVQTVQMKVSDRMVDFYA